jgi:Fic family protein
MRYVKMDKLQLLYEIDKIKAKLDAAPPFNEGELRRLREHFMVGYTYNSNAIEGSTLTLHETRLVVLEGLTVNEKPLRDHLDAIGHRDAFNYIIAKSKDKDPLSERTIKEIHSLVLVVDPENRGKYREIPVAISEALDTPPHPGQVPIQMEQYIESYLADTRHPVEKIADYHIHFERIHPFVDGNGRTGRLIMNLELIKAGYAPIDIKFQDRKLYIECFRDYVRSGNSDTFIMMALKYELEELNNILSIASHKINLQ